MEEKKLDASTATDERKVPTYEDLKNYCNQLMMQRDQIVERYNQVTEVLNKLPWLFKVVEYAKAFNEEFVEGCIKEIEFIMTPPKQTDDNSKE